MRLFHFSDRADIGAFHPRPVSHPPERKPGMEWLNGPLVWAVDAWHQPLYLFPRECPRILLWQTDRTTARDWAIWCGPSAARMVAFIEPDWAEAVARGTICRYELPAPHFQPLEDAGMWVSDRAVTPVSVDVVEDLPAALLAQRVELRVADDLSGLRDAWSSTLHASGIRLRNARTWRSS